MSARRLPKLLLLALLALPFGLSAEPFSDDGGHDIGVLLEQARENFNVDTEDAVILLYQEKHHFLADGRRRQELHRLVWIRTARGIRSYADLRVPWDSAHQSLQLKTLRSWRPSDRQWTESGPTAVVPTTPYAFGRAPDYTHIRETMFLTDGVELPCVLELRYVIEDRVAFAGGSDGIHAMPQVDPCLISELELGAAPAAGLQVQVVGLNDPEPNRDEATGLALQRFHAERLDAQPWPHPPAAELAHVTWSTWSDHEALGRELTTHFDAATVLKGNAKEAAEEAVTEARSSIERAEKLAAWVAESTRYIAYDRQWFPTPRPAQKIWETAYAHALDRAALAAAALRGAGLDANLAFRRPRGASRPEAATLSGLEGPFLWVAGSDFQALYDPATSALRVADPAFDDGSLWRLGELPLITGPAAGNSAYLRLDLSWDEEKKTWHGTGMLRAAGVMSPFAAMQGLEAGRAEKALGAIAGAVLSGLELTGHNFEHFGPQAVHTGFSCTLPAGERDALERLHLQLGDPTPTLNDPLHAATPLHESARGSTVHLPAPFELVVELHLNPGALELVHLPAAAKLENTAGSFKLTAQENGEEIIIRRSLELADDSISSSEWPELRALLLANGNLRHGSVYLR